MHRSKGFNFIFSSKRCESVNSRQIELAQFQEQTAAGLSLGAQAQLLLFPHTKQTLLWALMCSARLMCRAQSNKTARTAITEIDKAAAAPKFAEFTLDADLERHCRLGNAAAASQNFYLCVCLPTAIIVNERVKLYGFKFCALNESVGDQIERPNPSNDCNLESLG
jgi:hypothetical protein